jgi:hypothetical protein
MVCMKCGAEATVHKAKTFSWHPAWVLLLLLAGLIPFVIVALVLSKRMRVRAPMCAAHAGHWFWRQFIVLGSLAALVVVGIVAMVLVWDNRPGNTLGGYVCMGSVVLLIGWLVLVLILQGTAIQPVEITDRSITLKRVSPHFLEALEEFDRAGRAREFRPRPRSPQGPADAFRPAPD